MGPILSRNEPSDKPGTIHLSVEQLHSLGGDPARNAQNIGEELVRYRNEHGISQRRLAQMLRVNPNTIVTWELKRRVPKGEFRERVLAVLGAM
jgi:DNA-binding transcriptional regulator YiaG